jgi:nitroreductase
MELQEVLTTNAAYRAFTDEAIPRDVVYEILNMARFSPSGGNRQAWHVILVEDEEIRLQLQSLYQESWREYYAHVRQDLVPFAPLANRKWEEPAIDLDEAARTPAPSEFSDNLASVPILMCIFVDLTQLAVLDNGLDRQSIVGGASIYPFAENILLAARSLGYGGVMTTVLCRRENKVMDLLSVPEPFALAGVIALGRPEKILHRLRRRPVEAFTTIDRFNGIALSR